MFWTQPELVRPWRAALLLVVLAFASSGRAAAECGDHVTILSGAAADVPAAPPPCSGPNCSQKQDRHPPTPAPVSSSGTQTKDVTPAATAADPADSPTVRCCDHTSARPIRRAADIFHPPQCG